MNGFFDKFQRHFNIEFKEKEIKFWARYISEYTEKAQFSWIGKTKLSKPSLEFHFGLDLGLEFFANNGVPCFSSFYLIDSIKFQISMCNRKERKKNVQF